MKENIENILVSVIVPVYNAEAYLSRCVESVINQSYLDWELLLIDDGSPDICPELCDQWAEKDDRICVFHKENGGPSSARNVGLSNMRGKFVTFLDSDDCLTQKCLETCINEIVLDNLDVAQFHFQEIFPDGRKSKPSTSCTDVCDAYEYINSGKMTGCACGGMYNADIIRDFNIRYNENLHYLEDAFFVCEIIKHCKRAKRMQGAYYEYHKNPNGSDKPRDWDYYLDSIEYAAVYKERNPELGIQVDGWCTMLAMRYVTLAPKHDYSRFSKAWRSLKIEKEFLANAHRRDVVVFDKLQKLFGVHMASVIYRIVNKIVYRFKK